MKQKITRKELVELLSEVVVNTKMETFNSNRNCKAEAEKYHDKQVDASIKILDLVCGDEQ